MPRLIDREGSLRRGRPDTRIVAPVLSSLVDYGLHVVDRILTEQPIKEMSDARIATVFPFLHMTEMLDAIQVLLLGPAPIPARLQVRSAFEATLIIEYVLREDTQRRASAFILSQIKELIAVSERFDKDTDAGKRFEESVRRDPAAAGWNPTWRDSKAEVSYLKAILERPFFEEARTEFQLVSKRTNRSRPSWFSLFNGPANRRELAERVGRSGQYALLYDYWSGTAHVSDLYRQLGESHGEGFGVRQLRNPREIIATAKIVFGLFDDASDLIVAANLPDEVAPRLTLLAKVVVPAIKQMRALIKSRT